MVPFPVALLGGAPNRKALPPFIVQVHWCLRDKAPSEWGRVRHALQRGRREDWLVPDSGLKPADSVLNTEAGKGRAPPPFDPLGFPRRCRRGGGRGYLGNLVPRSRR